MESPEGEGGPTLDIPLTVTAPPRHRPALLVRSSLAALTARISESRVTTIFAPAGSGKTTVALQWFKALQERGRPGIWLAARAGIHDLASFRQALRDAGVAAGLPWERLDPTGADDSWLTQLATPPDRVPVIVIDDAQLLAGDVLQFLGRLIASARDSITWIVVARGQLAMPLARTRALGVLVEVDGHDLKLTAAEAAQLVSRVADADVDAESMQQIVKDMDGWAAGLVMAAESYRACRTRVRGRVGWSGRLAADVAAYFQEEVLALQSEPTQAFVQATSILEELTPPACVAVTDDQGAGEILNDAFRSGLFLNALDLAKGRYTYHPMFLSSVRDSLVRRAPARAAELHRRASLHFSSVGTSLAALEHAHASGDPEFLADQLERLANDLIYAGYLYRIDEVSAELPWSVISSRPMLLLALAWRRIRRLSYAAAERFIGAAEKIWETRTDDVRLRNLIWHRRIMLDAARDHMSIVEGDAEKLLLELGDEEPYLSCSLLGQLMMARHEFYHRHDLLKREAEMRRILERPGSEFASITLKATIAPTFIAQGKIELAQKLLEESLAHAEAQRGVGSGLAALPALPLAELLYDLGQIERATALIDRYLPVVREWGYSDQFSAGYLVRARLAAARGDTAAALAGLEEAHLIAIECGFDRFRTAVVAEQVRILVLCGRTADAEAAMRAGDMEVTEDPVPRRAPTHRDENVAIAWMRIEMYRNNLVRAQTVASRWLEVAKRNLATRSIVTHLILLAEIAVLQGNQCKARRLFRDAIELAQPTGWVRPFLDEGDVIGVLLRETYAGGPSPDTPIDEFGARLLRLTRVDTGADGSASGDEGLCVASQLANRELEILRMVGGGLRNHEVGQRLGLTEGTVKWYLQQIFDKLGVRRRSQAVLRARSLGLLGKSRDEPSPTRVQPRLVSVERTSMRTQ